MASWRLVLSAIIQEFKEHPGRPFILTFMILLIIAAVLFSLDNVSLANKFAEFAYYNLVLGVLLTLAKLVYEKRRSRKTDR